MSDFFWQGGRKVAIAQSPNMVTFQAPDRLAAVNIASKSGIRLDDVCQVSDGLVKASIADDRDAAINKLRRDIVVHHVYHAPEQPSQEYLITDTFFVKFKPGTSARSIEIFLRDESLEVVDDLGNGTILVRVTNATGRNCIKASNSAASRSDVEYAEPNLVRRLEKFAFIPPDPFFAKQWHLHSPNDGTDLSKGAGIFAADAWEVTKGVREVTICVADDGFDMTHPDFQGTGKVVGTLNVKSSGVANISFDTDVTPRPGDYHGTPCAGVAVAEQNAAGTVGVAPGCSFLAVRFPLNFNDAQMIKLFEKISREADVLSCSWGVGPADAPMSSALKDTITQLAAVGGKRGVGLVICVAAGNNNCPVRDLANTRTYEYRQSGIRYTYSGPIDRWIAAHPDVITVSASTSLKTRSCYSSWGKDIDVCAPSDNWDDMGRINPNGLGIFTTDNEGFGSGSDFTAGNRYTPVFGGTSSATPTVAGVCGLVISANRSLSGAEVRKIICESADKDLRIESETTVFEAGDFVSGFSLWFGYGKVNAFKAVTLAIPTVATELVVDVSSSPALDIPDNSVFVEDTIVVDEHGTIQDLRVGLDIKHGYIGDLRIDIIAPDGTAVTLHNKTGGAQVDLLTTLSSTSVPALAAFQGKSIQGTWKIRVSDHWRMDVGTLKSWRIVCKASPSNAVPSLATKRNRTRRRSLA
ncbi:S8 family serine peptidase [Pirellulaceae bacterium SH501]